MMWRTGLLALLLAGCATYAARPLETADVPARYHSRRVDDSALRAALDSLAVPPASQGWGDWEFAQAAWVVRPERPRLEAEIRAAEAALITAGAHPDPSLVTETEYAFSGSGTESRWGPALSGVFTVELGGKRGARIGRANAGILAAVARAAEEAWDVRWRVRVALANRERARRRAESAEQELGLVDSVLVLMRARYAEGVITQMEVARTESDRQEWAAEVSARRRELAESQAAFGAATGFPTSQLEPIAVRSAASEPCEPPILPDSLDEVALRYRRELLAALADYQVAEGNLRIVVAGTWPDISLGPGLFYDRGVGKWTIGFSLPSIALNRHRGPIAEAEAQREVAAHRVAEVQEGVLAEVGEATAACVAARQERDSLTVSGAQDRVRLVESAYARGEIGRLELALARLELARATRRLMEAKDRLVFAGLHLEHALGIWAGVPAQRSAKGDL